MTGSRKWAVIVTLFVIFGTGLVAGLWLNRRAALTSVPVPPPLRGTRRLRVAKPW